MANHLGHPCITGRNLLLRFALVGRLQVGVGRVDNVPWGACGAR